MAPKSLTQDRLRELLTYNPMMGEFRWKTNRSAGVKTGDLAGSVDKRGYVRVSIDAKLYTAHRLAWLYTYGRWPETELDHINKTPSDNRIANLRLATRELNTRNVNVRKDSLSGVKGVRWRKLDKRWESRIAIKGKTVTIGRYANIANATQARKIAEIILGWP